jgi:hypothetical protein
MLKSRHQSKGIKDSGLIKNKYKERRRKGCHRRFISYRVFCLRCSLCITNKT